VVGEIGGLIVENGVRADLKAALSEMDIISRQERIF
jgi:BMFP domain-containing protein YqiC